MKVFLATAYEESLLSTFVALVSQDRNKVHELTDSPEVADIILFTELPQPPNDWFYRKLTSSSLVKRFFRKSYIYNERDVPWFVIPGLYTSLSRSRIGRLQVSSPYVRTPTDKMIRKVTNFEKDIFCSFVGATVSSSLRKQLFQIKSSRLCLQDTSNQWFLGDGKGSFDAYDQNKRIKCRKEKYVEITARSKFVLCPRGNGPSSFRLYETMALGSVPVVISDEWVPPPGPDWDSFIIQIAERDVLKVAGIIEKFEPNAEAMGKIAKQAYDEWFAPDVIFHHMVEALARIHAKRKWYDQLLCRIPDRVYLEGRGKYILKQLFRMAGE